MFEIISGIIIVTVLLSDIFQAVLVPRFTPASLRLAPLLIGRISWPICRRIAAHIKDPAIQDLFLGSFAPMAFVMIFIIWITSLIVAFGLIVHGLGAEYKPAVHDFPTAAYLAGTSLLTLGFGDFVATSPVGRIVLLAGAVTGITIVAVGVSFLFSMQQSVHSREIQVNAFQSRITTNASAVELLLGYAELGITNLLVNQIQIWETWTADVLSSHKAFPLLVYFRSGHMCTSWITVLGVMLDAANLMTTTISDNRFGHAHFFLDTGSKLASFFSEYLRLAPEASSISKEDFMRAYQLLSASGYSMHEKEVAWEKFHITRSEYAASINALAKAFVCQTPGWLSQSSFLERGSKLPELVR